MTVKGMLAEIDSAELTDWIAYHRLQHGGGTSAEQKLLKIFTRPE